MDKDERFNCMIFDIKKCNELIDELEFNMDVLDNLYYIDEDISDDIRKAFKKAKQKLNQAKSHMYYLKETIIK